MVIYQLASAHYVSQALYVAAHLGVADLLAEGPQTHETLAAKTGTHAGSLRRVLRLLASAGVFAEDADGRFELTPVGSALRSGPGSARAAARLFAGPMVWQSWGDLLTTVRTGEPAFLRIFKTGSFEYFAGHPEEAAVFDEAMGSFTAMISGMVAAAYDFSAMREVIDIGGGDGRLLTGILRAYPSLRGTVFDLPRLAEGATRHIAEAGLADRYRFVGGDFFAEVPSGFDAYLLKHVIHDWDDVRAVRILENCRRAMGPQAKLLIVEGVYPPRIEGSPESRGAAANDVNMLVCTGGRQRSEAEFRALYAAAGFRLTRIVPTMAASCVIEGTTA
jgi:SAM-dependent methyltransferase